MENGPFTYSKGCFSIAMLVYQRVSLESGNLEDPELPEIGRPVRIPDVACLPTHLVETVSQLIFWM